MSKGKNVDLNRCKLSWVEGKAVLECPAAELRAATETIQTDGILIKEVKIVEVEKVE
ncbi:hypothetical protein ES703_68775 [subsurface metagenome]